MTKDQEEILARILHITHTNNGSFIGMLGSHMFRGNPQELGEVWNDYTAITVMRECTGSICSTFDKEKG